MLLEIGEHLKKVVADKRTPGNPKLEQNLWTYVSQMADHPGQESGDKVMTLYEKMHGALKPAEAVLPKPAEVVPRPLPPTADGEQTGSSSSATLPPKKRKIQADAEGDSEESPLEHNVAKKAKTNSEPEPQQPLPPSQVQLPEQAAIQPGPQPQVHQQENGQPTPASSS